MTGAYMEVKWKHTWGEKTKGFGVLLCARLVLCAGSFTFLSIWIRLSSELGKEQKHSSAILLFIFKRGEYFKILLKGKGLVTITNIFETLEILLQLSI